MRSPTVVYSRSRDLPVSAWEAFFAVEGAVAYLTLLFIILTSMLPHTYDFRNY